MAPAGEKVFVEQLRRVAGDTAPASLPALARKPVSNEKQLTESILQSLPTVLQSTLDLREIVRLFGQEVSRFVPHDEIHYDADTVAENPMAAHQHQCRYQLSLMGRSLGEIVLRRHHPFSVDDIAFLESALCALIYPLRNGLLYEQAIKTALKDPVTGINNRAALNTYLEQKISEHGRHGAPVSIILFDIDLFKTVNDRYGHIAGDTVLAAVASRTIACTRSSDIVFRYGGEEFLVVLSNTSLPGARLLAERIRRSIALMKVSLGGATVNVTISAGVAELETGNQSSQLIERADQQLYLAKAHGRNTVFPKATPMPQSLLQTAGAETLPR